VRRINIADPAFEYDEAHPAGFRKGVVRLGKLLGATEVGTSVYELPPGQSICPYHYEYGEEEWLLVLVGRPTLRTPEGDTELEPLDLVCFPTGPEGAHAVRNETEEVVRVLMYANVKETGAVVYPDSDKISVGTPNAADNLIVRRTSGVGYWDGETPA
jgi:uncharacterized cupin superfamily protein